MDERDSRRQLAPAPEDVARLSGQWGLGISHQDSTQFAELFGDLLAPLHYGEAATPPPQRGFELASVTGTDRYNAVVRWCDVPATEQGSLSGLRLSIKDSVSVAGIPLSCGSALLEGYVPERDSAVAERILHQGGQIVAITNMDDLAASADGTSSVYGPVLNPFDLARTAGGSSGGAAASLYLDGVDAAIGTDQGGSARVPASWCGVVGFKPTRGRVPYAGILGADQLLDHVGILGPDVEVVARVFAGIADTEGPRGVSPREWDASSPRTHVDATNTIAALRLGLLTEGLSPELGVEPAVADAVSELAAELEKAGARIERSSVPEHLATAEVETALSVEGLRALLLGGGNAYGWQSGSWPTLADALQAGFRSRAADLSPQVKAALLMGIWLEQLHHGEQYANARRRCGVIREAYDRVLSEVDALLMPATPYTAQPLAPASSIGDAVLRGWTPMANTAQFNLSGHPAISLPLCELDGLPLGVMLVGRRFEDARLLMIAGALEQALGTRPGSPEQPSARVERPQRAE